MRDSEVVEIYSIFVQTITANEQRRQNASAIYFTLISAAIAYWGVQPSIEAMIIIGPVTIGSLLWLLKLIYFRSLDKAKFEVIAEIEQSWSLRPFESEWSKLKGGKGWSTRLGLTWLEMAIPALIFLVGAGYSISRGLDLLANGGQ